MLQSSCVDQSLQLIPKASEYPTSSTQRSGAGMLPRFSHPLQVAVQSTAMISAFSGRMQNPAFAHDSQSDAESMQGTGEVSTTGGLGGITVMILRAGSYLNATPRATDEVPSVINWISTAYSTVGTNVIPGQSTRRVRACSVGTTVADACPTRRSLPSSLTLSVATAYKGLLLCSMSRSMMRTPCDAVPTSINLNIVGCSSTVGETDGNTDGDRDGTLVVGRLVGNVLGATVGLAVGPAVGTTVLGARVGRLEGPMVGQKVGRNVGSVEDGDTVGARVGGDGERVGNSVTGICVGVVVRGQEAHNIRQVIRSVRRSEEAQSACSKRLHRTGSGSPWHVAVGDAVGDADGLSDGVALVGEVDTGAPVGRDAVGVLLGIDVGGHASHSTGQAM